MSAAIFLNSFFAVSLHLIDSNDVLLLCFLVMYNKLNNALYILIANYVFGELITWFQ